MKKVLAFLLTVILTLGLCYSALAGSINVAASGLEITAVTELGRGQTKISWRDPASNGPYTVSYVMNLSGDFMTDQQATTGMWTAAENVTGTSVVVSGIIPGHYCWIVVRDMTGNFAIFEHWPESFPVFEDYTVDITLQLKTSRNGTVRNVNTFSSSDIKANLGSKDYGAYIRLDHPCMEWEHRYKCMITVTSVIGECIVVNLGDISFGRGSTYTYWEFFDLNWFFNILTSRYGMVEPGHYTWRLFCDGKEVVSAGFDVTE